MTNFHENDCDRLIEIVSTAAKSEALSRFRALGAGDVREKKSSIDLVTDADILVEKQVREALLALYPDALVVGEEACESKPDLIDALRGAELAFVIDPVDGTFNFQAGLPVFGTNLAVVSNGETIAGLIHEPVVGDTLVAVKGAGAQLVRSGHKEAIAVADVCPLEEMVGTISIKDLVYKERRRIAGNLAKTKMAFAYNCSSYEYWLVATGKVHFIGHHKLMPWDHLAGVLIHAEAGGYTARFDGTPYLPGDLSGGILTAPDQQSWEAIRHEIINADA